MPEQNEKVLDRVRQELSKDAKLGSRELYEMAKEWDSSIAEQTLQQFHARYVLPIKRERSGGKGKRGGRRGGGKAQAGAAAAAAPTENQQPAAQKARRRGRKQAEPGTDRDRVRAVLLDFARDFADAESRSEIVQVLSRVDEYVTRIAPNGG